MCECGRCASAGGRFLGRPNLGAEQAVSADLPCRAARDDILWSMTPWFEIRPSPKQGLGAFAVRRIAAGVRLGEYTGERLTPEQAEARYPDGAGERHHTYLFAIDDEDGSEVVIDAAVGGSDARFITHSCAPNCDAVVVDGRIWIETIRDVEPGEELAYDYAYVLEERHTLAAKRRYPCHCGAPECRGTILAKKR